MDQSTSSKTTDDIIEMARWRLNDAGSTRYHLEDAMLSYINDGLAYIARDSLSYQGTEDIDLAASQLEYTPTNDYFLIETVMYTDSSGNKKALDRGSVKEVGRLNHGVAPVKYYEWGSKIGVYPALSSVTTQYVTIYYIDRPAILTTGGSIPLPAVMDLALVYFVVGQAFIKEKRLSSSMNMMGMCDNEVSKARALLGI